MSEKDNETARALLDRMPVLLDFDGEYEDPEAIAAHMLARALSQARLDGERHGIERAAKVVDIQAAAAAATATTDYGDPWEAIAGDLARTAASIRALVVGGGGKGEGK